MDEEDTATRRDEVVQNPLEDRHVIFTDSHVNIHGGGGGGGGGFYYEARTVLFDFHDLRRHGSFVAVSLFFHVVEREWIGGFSLSLSVCVCICIYIYKRDGFWNRVVALDAHKERKVGDSVLSWCLLG